MPGKSTDARGDVTNTKKVAGGRGAKRGPRLRLETDERRSQLLEFGKHFFASHSYDDVSMDDVAAAAGVSKGLLFHYFGSKREFYVDVIRTMSLQLRRLTAPDPTLPSGARLRAGLDAHLTYAKEHGPMYVAFCRSGNAIAQEVHTVLEDHREAVMHYLLEGLGVSTAPPLLRAAMRAWMVMVEGVCLEWIAAPDLRREDLRELLIDGYRALLQRTLRAEPQSARLVNAMFRKTDHREVKLPVALTKRTY